ncbi:MAG: hypothetical protein ACSLFK_10690 [Gemmatimonadaceae bacterium]
MKSSRPTAIVLLFAGACTSAGNVPAVSLEPSVTGRVESIAVADASEMELLTQQSSLRPLRVDGNRLYYVSTPGLADQLRAIGYTPSAVDMQQVERRTVRVHRRGDEAELLRSGISLINRETDYWVVSGTLQQLRDLRGRGYSVTGVGRGEPRTREVRIRLPAGQSSLALAGFQLDIYSVRSTPTGVEITAGAFDSQIDALRSAGYSVERISTVPPRS